MRTVKLHVKPHLTQNTGRIHQVANRLLWFRKTIVEICDILGH
jgi:hypothetical protein